MRKFGRKYQVVRWALLMAFVCFLGMRPAHATIFEFSGTCSSAFCPLFGFGPDPSAVSGQLNLLDSAAGPDLTFDSTDVVSFSLTFASRNLDYVGPFLASNLSPGLVGRFNSTGLGIEQINLKDSLGQSFVANLLSEGSFSFTAIDTIGFFATGTPIAFETPDPGIIAASEPGSLAIFLLTLGSLLLVFHQRKPAVFSAQKHLGKATVSRVVKSTSVLQETPFQGNVTLSGLANPGVVKRKD